MCVCVCVGGVTHHNAIYQLYMRCRDYGDDKSFGALDPTAPMLPSPMVHVYDHKGL